MIRIEVRAVGLVTAVGLTAGASAAALRSGIMRFRETAFHDAGGLKVTAAAVRVADGLLGARRLGAMLCAALTDAEKQLGAPFPGGAPIVLGLADRGRPDRPPNLERKLSEILEQEGGWQFDPADSAVVASSNTSGARALDLARQILSGSRAPCVIVACVDSFLNAASLEYLESAGRLKTQEDPDGVIPGEAAGALVVTRAGGAVEGKPILEVSGIGFSHEPAQLDRRRANTGAGLATAIRACLSDARRGTRDTHFRLADVSGDRKSFSETQYALARTLTESHEQYPLWLPAESFGEIGAASAPAQIAVAAAAFAKGYEPGPAALCQFGSETGDRAAMLVRAR